MAASEAGSSEVVKVSWPQLAQRTCWLRNNGGSAGVTSAAGRSKRVRAAPAVRMDMDGGSDEAAEMNYEYLDHTADVQIHAWGNSIGNAFASASVGMFGYMVSLAEFDNALELPVRAEAHDLESLLFAFLDECLYIFHTDSFVMKHISIVEFDLENFRIRAVAHGGLFDVGRHAQGTEVKAITYSNMKIEQTESRTDVFVIVDI